METVTLRPFTARDADWLIARHGTLYAEHEGFDASFEALVAEKSHVKILVEAPE